MMYYLIAIVIITLTFWFLYKIKVVSVCPICAGVVITWIGSLIALYNNAPWANPIIIAILMGASLGALADKYGSGLGLFWKTTMVVVGLPIVYFLVQKSFYPALGLLALLLIVTIFSHRQRTPILRKHKDLFKECC